MIECIISKKLQIKLTIGEQVHLLWESENNLEDENTSWRKYIFIDSIKKSPDF